MEIKDLPYVNGLPKEGQVRINWIKDGEPLNGASTQWGSDGELNRGPNQVQANVVVLDENIKSLSKVSNTLTTDVDAIKDILALSTDTDALAQIGINKQNIELIQTDLTHIKPQINELETEVEFISEDIGKYNPELDSVYRTVRSDLLWIKTEMGRYPGQDINGKNIGGTESTGMKRRILDTAFAVNKQEERLSKLEDSFIDSDVGALTTEVIHLREELGPRAQKGIDPVYVRLNRNEGSVRSLIQENESIMDSIGMSDGVGSIITLVNKNIMDIISINSRLLGPTGISDRVETIETNLGPTSSSQTVNSRIKTNSDDINSLRLIVGTDTSSGMRAEIAWINQTVGIVDSGSPPPGSVLSQIKTLDQQTSALASTVQDLQVEIGNNTEGLKGQVIKLNRQINGTNPSGSTIEERGILATVKTHDTKIAQLNLEVQKMVPEAPIDGKAYVRKDGAWVDITTLSQ